MQEIEEAIVLAAGSSRRMGALCSEGPKCLLPYKGETILARLLRQLTKSGVKRVLLVVGYRQEKVREAVKGVKGITIQLVENPRYEEDVNIYSMKLALAHVTGPVVIIEADTVMEDHMVTYVTGSDFEGKSVWFVQGPFRPEQYGGILKTDAYGNITDIRIVPRYEEQYNGYAKLTGLMRIAGAHVPRFRQLVDEYAQRTLKQYYLIPWIEHLAELPCVEGNAEHYLFRTFNTAEDYEQLCAVDLDHDVPREERIELMELAKLKPIERFDEQRVTQLVEKITREQVWSKPLYIEKNHRLVLDGTHRHEAALRLGLKHVPVQGFNYEDVKVWTLRKEEQVSIPLVVARATQGKIYPYKTVKHRFPRVIGECAIGLEELKSKPRRDA